MIRPLAMRRKDAGQAAAAAVRNLLGANPGARRVPSKVNAKDHSQHPRPASRLLAALLYAVLGLSAGWWAASSAHRVEVARRPSHEPDLGLEDPRSAAEIGVLRASTIEAVFGPGGLPSRQPDQVEVVDPPLPGVIRAQRLTVRTAGGAAYPLLLSAGHDRLAIYHAGHQQDPLRDAREPIEALLAAGFDVLAMAMPAEPHSRMADLPRPLEPFLAPVAVGLNYALARGQYRTVVMIGLSGGGWTTVVYSAIDPRVRRSYPVAGSLPRRLRGERDVGDYEQDLPGLPVGYIDLYLMASTEGRSQLQVFNRNDPCCFAGTGALSYADGISERAQSLGGQFGVLVVENNRHEIPASVLMLTRGL